MRCWLRVLVIVRAISNNNNNNMSETLFVPGELRVLGVHDSSRLSRPVSFRLPRGIPCSDLSGSGLLLWWLWWLWLLFLTSLLSLCLVGISQTPGCVSLLPVSLFSNSNAGETSFFSFARPRHAVYPTPAHNIPQQPFVLCVPPPLPPPPFPLLFVISHGQADVV